MISAVCAACDAGADLEVVIRARDAELGEEGVRHVGVVVLPGVDDDVADAGPPRGGPRDRRELHEVGARADDREQGHGPSAHRDVAHLEESDQGVDRERQPTAGR